MDLLLSRPLEASRTNSRDWDELAPKLDDFPIRRFTAAWVILDALLVALAFVGAHVLRESAHVSMAPLRVFGASLLAAMLALPLFSVHGLYDPRIVARGWLQGSRLTRAWLFLVALFALILFSSKASTPLESRLALVLFAGLGLGLTGAARLVWRGWLRSRFSSSLRGARVIVGTGTLAERIANTSRKESWGPSMVGFVDEESPRADSDRGRPWLGDVASVGSLAREDRITEVLVAREDLSRGSLVRLAHGWLDAGVRVLLASTTFEVMVARASGAVVGGVPVVELQRSPQRGMGFALKRTFDLAAVTLGGILLLPLLGAIAFGVKLTSSGPVLYRQTRLGRGGRPFTMYKFRSMVSGSDDSSHRSYVAGHIRGEQPQQEKRVYKLVNDPRITRFGHFLRRTSLDELPQLWNVLRGDMSLVGPRPCLPYEWELYEDWQRHRLDATPGITGLWQVTGRSQVCFEDMVLLDLHYIANWSFFGDMSLLARTIPVVMRRTGAH